MVTGGGLSITRVGKNAASTAITFAAAFSWAPFTWMVVTEPPLAASALAFCLVDDAHRLVHPASPSRGRFLPGGVLVLADERQRRTFWYTLTPTFITMTGIPAEVACLTGPDSTAASGIVTTSPFGRRTAAWLL